VCILMLAAFTTAYSTPNFRGDHQVVRVLQEDSNAPSILTANHLEKSAATRKLYSRRRSRPQKEWKPRLYPIPEDNEIGDAIPLRNPKRNVITDGYFGTTGASQPQNIRPPLQRKGYQNRMHSFDSDSFVLKDSLSGASQPQNIRRPIQLYQNRMHSFNPDSFVLKDSLRLLG
jgi:hypothetical protein